MDDSSGGMNEYLQSDLSVIKVFYVKQPVAPHMLEWTLVITESITSVCIIL